MICTYPKCMEQQDPYSRLGFCEKHQKLREKWKRWQFFFRLFTMFQGAMLAISLILALVGINSPLTSFIFVGYTTILFLGGGYGFIHFTKLLDMRRSNNRF